MDGVRNRASLVANPIGFKRASRSPIENNDSNAHLRQWARRLVAVPCHRPYFSLEINVQRVKIGFRIVDGGPAGNQKCKIYTTISYFETLTLTLTTSQPFQKLKTTIDIQPAKKLKRERQMWKTQVLLYHTREFSSSTSQWSMHTSELLLNNLSRNTDNKMVDRL